MTLPFKKSAAFRAALPYSRPKDMGHIPPRESRTGSNTMGDTLPNGAPAPVADNASTPQVGTTENTPALQTPLAGEANNSTMTPEQTAAELAKVRREAAGYRTKLNAFETKAAEEAAAKMSDLEKAQAKATQLEQALSTQTQREHERTVRYEVQLHAAKLGIIDPDAAYALMDRAQLEFKDDGTPKNAEKLLKDLIASKPYLAGPVASGSATNPARNPAHNGTFTQSQISAMSPTEYQQNRTAIFAAQKEGRILQG